MRWIHRAVVAALPFFAASLPAAGEDPKATLILDKAMAALGGEERLAKVKAFKWMGTVTFGARGALQSFDAEFTVEGLDHLRREWGSNVLILAGGRGWQKRGQSIRELMADAVDGERRNIYLQVIPVTIVPLKNAGYTCVAAAEEKVGDRPAAVVKVTAPDGKDFTLFFDKETGLPVKEVVQIALPDGQEATTESTYADYKDFGGIKKATKIEFKSGGSGNVVSFVISDFKVLDKVPDDTFAEPK